MTNTPPSHGDGQPSAGTAPRHNPTPEQKRRARERFRAETALAVVAHEMGRLEVIPVADDAYSRANRSCWCIPLDAFLELGAVIKEVVAREDG